MCWNSCHWQKGDHRHTVWIVRVRLRPGARKGLKVEKLGEGYERSDKGGKCDKNVKEFYGTKPKTPRSKRAFWIPSHQNGADRCQRWRICKLNGLVQIKSQPSSSRKPRCKAGYAGIDNVASWYFNEAAVLECCIVVQLSRGVVRQVLLCQRHFPNSQMCVARLHQTSTPQMHSFNLAVLWFLCLPEKIMRGR